MTASAEETRNKARELGFLACGITDPAPLPHAVELDRWLEAGLGGTMRYLHRQAARRKEPQRIVPGSRSIVVVLDNYFLPDATTAAPRIAKYARGTDYHLDLVERLRALATWLAGQGAAIARPYADAGPVPERELAQRAGLGWIGKNTMLIRPGAGSFFFIGSIFTDLVLPPDLPLLTDHCGTCTRCLDACPTGALVAPRVLDATRCISYLTIEYRKDFSPAEEASLNGWAFGCDICNDVCPWNIRFAEPTGNPAYASRPAPDTGDPDYFDRMNDAEFGRRFADTPLSRPGLAGMRRNWRAAHPAGARRAP